MFIMSLKHELTAVDATEVNRIAKGYFDKMDSMPEDSFFEETVEHMAEYAGINEIINVILDDSNNLFTAEEAQLIAFGALTAVNVLTEIAEVKELPPISLYSAPEE